VAPRGSRQVCALSRPSHLWFRLRLAMRKMALRQVVHRPWPAASPALVLVRIAGFHRPDRAWRRALKILRKSAQECQLQKRYNGSSAEPIASDSVVEEEAACPAYLGTS